MRFVNFDPQKFPAFADFCCPTGDDFDPPLTHGGELRVPGPSSEKWTAFLNNPKVMCMVMCMRTNIVIDPKLMAEAKKLAGTKTMKETVDLALREMVARHKRLGILELRGKIKWEGDLNEWRRGRF